MATGPVHDLIGKKGKIPSKYPCATLGQNGPWKYNTKVKGVE
jgi:hypothetical protein